MPPALLIALLTPVMTVTKKKKSLKAKVKMLYFRRFFSRGLLPVSRMPHILVPLNKHIFFPPRGTWGERRGGKPRNEAGLL